MNDRMDPLEEIRGMTPDVVAKMQEMLGNPKIPAVVKVRIIRDWIAGCDGVADATVDEPVDFADGRSSAAGTGD